MREMPRQDTRITTGASAKAPHDRVEATAPVNLAQLIATARANLPDDIERLLLNAQAGEAQPESVDGSQYLLFSCGDAACAVSLAALREVLPALPQVVHLPFSPEWMLGVFPLRSEMLGLVDPAPLLFGATAPHSAQVAEDEAAPLTTLVVGSGERSLAWAVTTVGAIIPIRDDAITAGAQGATATTTASVVERYNAGVYTTPDGAQRIVIVRAETLLDDLLSALEESDGCHG